MVFSCPRFFGLSREGCGFDLCQQDINVLGWCVDRDAALCRHLDAGGFTTHAAIPAARIDLNSPASTLAATSG